MCIIIIEHVIKRINLTEMNLKLNYTYVRMYERKYVNKCNSLITIKLHYVISYAL